MTSTVDAARGRWREILPRLGVDSRFLNKRHGPCPVCGGKDRFRFDDREGSGSYFCNKCGAGTGLLLVRKLHSWDHATACRAVHEIIGRDPEHDRRDTRPAGETAAARRGRLEQLLAEARQDSIVKRYLAARGLTVIPAVLHGHPRLTYADNGSFLGRFPAMLAPVIDPDGNLQSVHRTYLADVPTRKKLMPAVETVRGAAVRLFDPAETLGVAEGIETAIAAYELFGVPTWATISTAIMEGFVPPAGVQHLIVFADHDANYAGQKSAYALAQRLAGKVRIRVRIPPEPDTDWLDVLRIRRSAA
jgi:putative DNA primase/helicase